MTFTVLCIYKLYFFWSVIYTTETIWQFIVTYRSNAFCILKTTKIIKEIVVDNDFVWFSYLKKSVHEISRKRFRTDPKLKGTYEIFARNFFSLQKISH